MDGSLNSFLSALVGGGFALCGVAFTHHLYIKRWERERREAYRAELFKVKLEVYRELVGMYFKFASETFDSAFDDAFMERFMEARGHVLNFVQGNSLVMSEKVCNLASKSFIDEIEKVRLPLHVGRTAMLQYQALSEACRAELGVEAVSKDLLEMFKERLPGPIKTRITGKEYKVADGDEEKRGEEDK